MTLKELREQQARLNEEARGYLDEAQKDGTKEDRAKELEEQFDKAMAEFDRIGARIERQERADAAQKRLEEAAKSDRPEYPDKRADQQQDDGEGMTYEKAFFSYLRAMGNEGAMDPEARAVLARGFDRIEARSEKRAQTTTAAAGGYTIPDGMMMAVVKSMAAWGPMYDPGVTMEIMTSGGNQIPIPTVNDTSRALVQHTQGTTLTDDGGSDATFGQKTLDAYAYNTEWLRVSKELVDDSAFNIQAVLADLLGEGLGRRANTELTTGDGTGDPNGVVTASAAGKTAAATTTVTFDELIDLLHSVDPAYRGSPRTRWMMNDTTFSIVRKLKYSDGHYIWDMGNVQGGSPPTLLGYPYSINQAMPAMTTGLKPVLFGDFGKYYVRKVGAPLIGAIQDKDFWPGFGIAGYIRLDGELVDTAAVKHLVMA